jgi:hypothetical protein
MCNKHSIIAYVNTNKIDLDLFISRSQTVYPGRLKKCWGKLTRVMYHVSFHATIFYWDQISFFYQTTKINAQHLNIGNLKHIGKLKRFLFFN